MTSRTSATAAACVVAGAAAGAGWAVLHRQRRPQAGVPRDGRMGASHHTGSLPDKAVAVATLANEWARDTAARLLGWRNSDEAEAAIAADVANELAHVLAAYGERAFGEAAPQHRGPARQLVGQASSR